MLSQGPVLKYRSLASLVADVFWISNLVDQRQSPLSVTPLIYCDNLSAVLLPANPILHSKSKHLELTKPVSFASFLEFRSKLRIVGYQSLSLRGYIKDST